MLRPLKSHLRRLVVKIQALWHNIYPRMWYMLSEQYVDTPRQKQSVVSITFVQHNFPIAHIQPHTTSLLLSAPLVAEHFNDACWYPHPLKKIRNLPSQILFLYPRCFQIPAFSPIIPLLLFFIRTSIQLSQIPLCFNSQWCRTDFFCQIWGLHSFDHDSSGLLGCYTIIFECQEILEDLESVYP